MVKKSDLVADAAALEAELAKRAPRVDILMGIFEKVERHCHKRIASVHMHKSGLIEQIVALGQA